MSSIPHKYASIGIQRLRADYLNLSCADIQRDIFCACRRDLMYLQ